MFGSKRSLSLASFKLPAARKISLIPSTNKESSRDGGLTAEERSIQIKPGLNTYSIAIFSYTEWKYVPSHLWNNREKDIARCRFSSGVADAMWHNTGVVKIKGNIKSGIVSIPNPPDPDRNYLASNQPKGELDSLFLEDVININDVGRKSPR